MFTLAHLSDPHLPLPAAFRRSPRLPAAKRLSCLLSWQTKRKAIHRPEILRALLADIQGAGPDHVAVTGDLVNLSLPEEFAAAETWLTELGRPDRVTVVPGNHDALVDDLSWSDSIGRWGAYMTADGSGPGDGFVPFVRRRGPVALVGLSTAVPTPLFMAGGILGARQIAAAENHLAELGREGVFRIVLLHHPPLPARHRNRARKMLQDHAELRAAIARTGAELVLHGHSHRFGLERIDLASGGYAPVMSVPSASALASDEGGAAGWNLLTVEGDGAGRWRVEVTSRSLSPARDGLVTRGKFRLSTAS